MPITIQMKILVKLQMDIYLVWQLMPHLIQTSIITNQFRPSFPCYFDLNGLETFIKNLKLEASPFLLRKLVSFWGVLNFACHLGNEVIPCFKSKVHYTQYSVKARP